MLHRLKCGSTQENNTWRLPEGVITWDRELKQLRLHNGRLPGGFAINTEQAYQPLSRPGPEVLKAGTPEKGYYGVLTTEGMGVTSEALSSLCGISTGTGPITSNWLKFAWQGKTIYVASRTIRYNLTWNDINAQGCIRGEKVITLNNVRYRVRVMKTAVTETINTTAGDLKDNPSFVRGSEWNELMYRVAASAPTNQGEWDTLSNASLGLASGNGTVSFCQEINTGKSPNTAASRGYQATPYIGYFANLALDRVVANFGWRPVLELIG